MRYLALALLALSPLAHATDVTLTCDTPPQYTDGTAIPAGTAFTFKFYYGLKGTTKTLLVSKATCSTVHASAPVGIDCYEMTATVAAVESAHTNEVCTTVAAPTPNAPGNPRATQTPIAPTAYSVIKSTESLVMLPVGTVKADTACDLDQAVMLRGQVYNAVPTASVTFTGTARPVVVFALCG